MPVREKVVLLMSVCAWLILIPKTIRTFLIHTWYESLFMKPHTLLLRVCL